VPGPGAVLHLLVETGSVAAQDLFGLPGFAPTPTMLYQM
jgi:hypothetical protein